MQSKAPRQIKAQQDPAERAKNFNEVSRGFTEEQAIIEAQRCISCKNMPCVSGCPVNIDIPEFIERIASGDFSGAINTLKEKNNLPAVCGRVCPQETQCEKPCTLGIKGQPVAIGALERFAADWEIKNSVSRQTEGGQAAHQDTSHQIKRSGIKIALVGSGPASLSCAGDLARMGYSPSVFESLHLIGGVLRYGIPEFRLPKNILDKEINYLKSLGVSFVANAVIGRMFTIDELFKEGFKAIFIGTGAGLPNFLHIPGENLNGVYSANEFLVRVNLMKGYMFPKYDTPVKIGNDVAVIGAGNTAMDAVRCALRLGAKKAYIIYRRSEKEMPARAEEVEHAKEEGIEFRLLTNPVRFIGSEDGWIKEMECVKMELSEPDASGRRRTVALKGSEYKLKTDTAIIAAGEGPNPLLAKLGGFKLDEEGHIIIDDNRMTSINGVFAGGDITARLPDYAVQAGLPVEVLQSRTKTGTVIRAMGDGKRAAVSINEWIKKI